MKAVLNFSFNTHSKIVNVILSDWFVQQILAICPLGDKHWSMPGIEHGTDTGLWMS